MKKEKRKKKKKFTRKIGKSLGPRFKTIMGLLDSF